MTSMVLERISMGAVTVDVTTCSCAEDCETRFVLGSLPPLERWMMLALFDQEDRDRVLGELSLGLSDPQMLYTLAHSLALLGTSHDRLLVRETALAQYTVWDNVPEWIARLDVEYIERLRGLVFGDDITKTIAALHALDRAWDSLHETPRPARCMEELIDEQMIVGYSAKYRWRQ